MYGLPYIRVESSDASILHALETAMQLYTAQQENARQQEQLQIQLERYQNILDYTHDAIIAVDETGRISVTNQIAEQMLRPARPPFAGRLIEDVLANTQLTSVLKSGEAEIGQMMNIHGTLVSTNRVVATFQDIKTLQKAERNIRIKLHEKGLIAKYCFSDILGHSPAIVEAKRLSEKYADSNLTVMLYGETGTGKEIFAHAVHLASSRRDGPFVAINVAAMPENLLESELFGYAFNIDGFDKITDIDAFNNGYIQVQDQSSILAGHVYSVKGDENIIDICAAPGGKTLHAADRLNAAEKSGIGNIISCDLTEQKVKLISDNIKRNGFRNISVVKNDALVYKKEWENTADIIIADLPCSGLGVIGKKCDIKYKTKREDIASLSKIQKEILKNVSRYLKKGGQLIYSTCTIAKEENEDNAEWILENLPFEKADISKRMPEKLKKYMTDNSYIQILPDMAQTDGFFVAAFIKK